MDFTTKSWTLEELSSLLGGELVGPADWVVKRPGSIESGDAEALGFAQDGRYLAKAIGSAIGALLIPKDANASGKPAIRVPRPREAFAHFLHLYSTPMAINAGVHVTALVHESATIDPSASVGPYVVIERGCVVEANSKIYALSYIGENCKIGKDSILYPNVILYKDVSIGDRCIVHSGAVIGADGFGFNWDGKRHVKIPQVGGVEIGADVEIGSGSTVDRATIGKTIIKPGVKVDNLVMIGHNVVVGSNTVIASQSGISGSSSVGDRCTLAGQVGLVDHIHVGDDIILTARTTPTKNLSAPGPYRGSPATPYMQQVRLEASLRKMPELLKRVKELEQRLADLEGKS